MEGYSFVELADMQLVYDTLGEHWIGQSGTLLGCLVLLTVPQTIFVCGDI